MDGNLITWIPVGIGSRGIWYLYVLVTPLHAHVDESMLFMGGVEFLDGGHSVPRDGNGPRS